MEIIASNKLNPSNLPDFLIVGAAKAGTTSLYYYLDQHPNIYMPPVKEPCFLAYGNNIPPFKVSEDTIFTLNDYSSLFKGKGNNQITGEASAIYLYYYSETISNIEHLFGGNKPKIIIMLRNPAQRAYSQYMMNIRDLREELSFEDALAIESKRKEENWNSDFFYRERGFYSKSVKAYMDKFNCKIVFFEDFINNRKSVIEDILNFLDLGNSFDFKAETSFNSSGKPKIKWINKMIRRNTLLKRMIKFLLPRKLRNSVFERIKNKIYKYNLEKVPMKIMTYNELIDIYHNDITNLEQLLKKDLSHWKKKK